MASRSRARAAARRGSRREVSVTPPPRTPEPGAQRLDLSRTPLRALIARPHLSAALLFGVLVLAYLGPVLVGGQSLLSTAVLYEFPPWSHLGAHGVVSSINPALTDITQSHYPWNAYARELLHSGTFPAWNPYVLAGAPFFNNPQTVLLSPFSVPLWILPLNYALGLSAALKLWAAAFGTYLLVRELRLGFLPGLLAGVAYGLCSFNVVWLAHESLPGVAALLPWMLWLTERLLRRGGLRPAIALVVVTAAALAGGHPGTQVHVLAATGIFAAVRVATLPELSTPDRLRRLATAAGALVLGVLLIAVLFVPELLSSHGTIGTRSRLGGAGSQPGIQMPFRSIRTVLFPDWWGRPNGLEAQDQPAGATIGGVAFTANFNERTYYAGVVAAILAAMALVTRGGWRRKAPFAVLGALTLAVVLRAPGLHWLVTHVPPFDVIQNQRAHFVFELSLAVLGAFGLEAVLKRSPGERARLGVALGAVGVGLLLVLSLGTTGGRLGQAVRYVANGTRVTSDEALALASVLWFLPFALGVVAVLLALRRWPQRRAAIGAALVLLAALDMLHFVHGYQPIGPASKLIPPRTPSIAYLQRHADDGRFVGLGNAFLNDWAAMRYHLRDVRGYDPPQPTLRYYRLWRVINPGQRDWQGLEVEGLSRDALQLLSVLGVRYVAADAGTDVTASAEGGHVSLTRVYAGRDATIYENPLAAPRALVPSRAILSGGEEDTLAALEQDGFDPRADVVVERAQPGAAALAAAPPVHGSARVVRERNASVTLAASLDRRGLVVLNDQLTDGWRVAVDGRPAAVVRVNDVMRGVVVPAGRHTVVWSYRVPGLRIGLALSVLSLLLVLVGAAFAIAGPRRRRAR